ncbi:hypothetical protein V497_01436 [Pseudogymnoascus sp. VKM F-4516 (FW-969)]|nr:hypothetical protein V497_01436 [Pseudogymnoascus sp. VKM F-4516 (FW-969)]
MIEYADEDVYAYNCEWFEIIRPGAALWLIKRIVRNYEIRKLRLGLLGREFLGPFGDIGQPETNEDLDARPLTPQNVMFADFIQQENREVMDWQVVDELNAILGITRNENGLGRFEERD